MLSVDMPERFNSLVGKLLAKKGLSFTTTRHCTYPSSSQHDLLDATGMTFNEMCNVVDITPIGHPNRISVFSHCSLLLART